MLRIEDPLNRPAPGWALWALGFRPFYLLCALWMVLAVPVWLAMLAHGYASASHLQGMAWHGHEMLFGFAGTLMVGFLLTAGRTWSGQDTPQGRPLMVLALGWVSVRVLMLTPWSAVNLWLEPLFFGLAALGLWRAFRRGQNRRNDFFPLLLVALGLLAGLHHAAVLWPQIGLQPSALLQVGLTVVLVAVTVMTGRVVPMFTRNALPQAQVRPLPALEKPLLVITVLALLGAAATLQWPQVWLLGGAMHGLSLLAALLHLLRWSRWDPCATRRTPLLWILHLSYLWLPVGLLLRALPTGWQPMLPQLANHALTVGVVTGLGLGMMTRTARGHTGRLLQAGRAETLAYALVVLAVLCRVGLPLLWPAAYLHWLGLSGTLVVLAFSLYLWVYTPWLLRARVDGRPG